MLLRVKETAQIAEKLMQIDTPKGGEIDVAGKSAFVQNLRNRGVERDQAEAAFLQHFPEHNEFDFTAFWLSRAGLPKDTERTTSSAQVAPQHNGMSIWTIPELALPADVVQGDNKVCLIPVELARLSWIFGIKEKPCRAFTTKDKHVRVGEGDLHDPDRSAWSLTTYHSRVAFALFYRLQQLQFPFRHIGPSQEFLELDVSLYEIHKIMNPASAYGSDTRERINRALTRLSECPIRCESLGSGAVHTTTLLHSVRTAPHGRKLRIRVSAHYSSAFIRARGKAGIKDQVKPFLWGVYRELRSQYARPLYLHLDWTLSSHQTSELRLEEVMQRAGSVLADGSYKPSLKFASQRRSRLSQALVELEGLPLSTKGDSKIHIHEARVSTSPDRTLFKLVAAKQQFVSRGDLASVTYRASITELPYFKDQLMLVRSRSRHTGPPSIAA